MTFTPQQVEALNAKLDAKHVKQRSQAGRSLSYVEGWHAIAEANRIFGHDGWCSYTDDLRQLGDPREIDGKWRVAWMAKVRIVVGTVVREGVGYGSGIDRDLGSAHESAIKEAETDARKRGLMTFGWPFGLALYDKAQEHVDKEPLTPPPASKVPPPPSPSGKGNLFWIEADGSEVRFEKGSDWFAHALKKLRSARDPAPLWAVNGKTANEIVERAPDQLKARAEELRDQCIRAVDDARDLTAAA